MVSEEQVKLLGLWSSPFVRRVEWTLKLKGIQFQVLEENLANKSALLLQGNPVYQRVPVLIHGGKSVCESLNIIEYIDETWPENPLFSQDPYQNANTRFWAKFVEDKVTQGIRKVLLTQGEEQENAVKQFEEAMCIMEGEAKGKLGKFFGGENIGFLDLVLGWTVLWLPVVEQVSLESSRQVIDYGKFPSFSKWMEDFKGLYLIQENLPDKEELVVYLRNIRMKVLATN
ncbi:glutathione transferase [Ranunculus cassubicifolius]